MKLMFLMIMVSCPLTVIVKKIGQKPVQENTHRAEVTTAGLDSAADCGLQDSQL